MAFGSIFGRTFLVLIAGSVSLIATPSVGADSEQLPLAGVWVGQFEFAVLGERAKWGPASVIDTKERSQGGEPVKFGEGDITITIENQLAKNFFGRWSIGERGGAFVCTMIDDKNFLCGGETANVLGVINGGDSMRMCWSYSGKEATSGCADLTRPQG